MTMLCPGIGAGACTNAPAVPLPAVEPHADAPAAADRAHDRAERSPPPAAQQAAAAPEDPGPEPDPGPGVCLLWGQ